jgi:hypothetical protein
VDFKNILELKAWRLKVPHLKASRNSPVSISTILQELDPTCSHIAKKKYALIIKQFLFFLSCRDKPGEIMRIDLLYGIYSSLFVTSFVNTAWKAINDQILPRPFLSWSTEHVEHHSDEKGDDRCSSSLDQGALAADFVIKPLVTSTDQMFSRQFPSGRRAQVFYRGLGQSSAFVLSYNNTIPAILDVFWVDSGTSFEIPTASEVQYSKPSMVGPITVTSSTLPVLIDKLRYSWAYNQATFDMVTAPGFDLTWNFTALTSDENITEEYLSPSEGVYAARFPTANLMTRNAAGEERYFIVSPSGLRELGFTKSTLFGQPFTVVYDYTWNGVNPNAGLNERFTPLNFFDTYAQSANILEGYKFSEMPLALRSAWLAAGLTTTDSIRLRHSYSNYHSVNANGTVTIPGPNGEFPVLRMVTTQYREARVDAHVIPLGWLDITDLTMQYFPASIPSLGVDTTGAHTFFNDVTKEEIARITLDAQGRPHDVRFKNNAPPSCFDPDLVNPTLNGNPISPGTYAASQTITSGGRVATGTTVQFTAGIQIYLEPGFSAEAGSSFSADVISCPANVMPPGSR